MEDENNKFYSLISDTTFKYLFKGKLEESSIVRLLNTLDKKVSEVDTDVMMEMSQILSGISGELTVDKMIEAYSNSDLFKQMHK